jgi:hypothetical protein
MERPVRPFELRHCTRCSQAGMAEQVDNERHLMFDCVTSQHWREGDYADLYAGVQQGDLRTLMDVHRDQHKQAELIYLCMKAVDEHRMGEADGEGELAAENEEE